MIDKTKLERQARATARRAGKVLHKCDDDRFLIVCPRTHHITPCKGMLTLREVLDWFEPKKISERRPSGPASASGPGEAPGAFQ
jgi:hypothetical protein